MPLCLCGEMVWMNTVKHIISRYTGFLWAILQPIGVWGVFAVAALDGAAVGLPMDVVVGGYVAQDHKRLLLYVLMAAAGSSLGSLVIYAIGYKAERSFCGNGFPPHDSKNCTRLLISIRSGA